MPPLIRHTGKRKLFDKGKSKNLTGWGSAARARWPFVEKFSTQLRSNLE